MDFKLPGILLTGASGFVGRNFIEAAEGKFRLFCIARRSQRIAGIAVNNNIRWTQIDIGNFSNIEEVAQSINNHGGVDYILHLAGYYDFTMNNVPEYHNTNVTGTRNILELAKLLEIKRFLFASSLAACKFTTAGNLIDELTPSDAEFPYAKSKHICEELMKEYSKQFPCTVIRFAAVYSDWCEYPPLYMFLETWLSRKWNSKILGGKGESSITYIHINDLNKLFFRIIEKTNTLPGICTYIASPRGTISHNELFKTATKFYFGKIIKPIRVPKFLAFPGGIIRYYLGKILGKPPFECPWMMKYIDKKLCVDATYTYRTLSWRTTQRYDVLRRLLFLIEKKKNHQIEWRIRNEAALSRIAQRPNIIGYNMLVELRETIVNKMLTYVLSKENKFRFINYQKIEKNLLKWCITFIYQLIATTIKSKDRQLMQNYLQIITYRRFLEGFNVEEIITFLQTLVNIINSSLLSRAELKDMKQEIYDFITISMQLTIDEIEDYFEFLETQSPESLPDLKKLPSLINDEDIKRIIRQLEDTFYDVQEFHLDADYAEDNEIIDN